MKQTSSRNAKSHVEDSSRVEEEKKDSLGNEQHVERN